MSLARELQQEDCQIIILRRLSIFSWKKIIKSLHAKHKWTQSAIGYERLRVKSTMGYITIFLQLFVAFGLLNVWLIRCNKKTTYRGSNACSLKDEFTAYGLPLWSFYVIGFIKISSAISLLLGLWEPFLVFPSALIISLMMVGALCMHIKVRDPVKKSLPALIMLFCSIGICLGSFYHRWLVFILIYWAAIFQH